MGHFTNEHIKTKQNKKVQRSGITRLKALFNSPGPYCQTILQKLYLYYVRVLTLDGDFRFSRQNLDFSICFKFYKMEPKSSHGRNESDLL